MNLTIRALALAPSLALVLSLAPAHAQTVTCDAVSGVPPTAATAAPAHWVLTGPTVGVSLNPSLDPALETSFGDAASRYAAFQQAVAEWNAALTNVGASLQLVAVSDASAWATEQSSAYCQDANGTDVFDDYRALRWRDDVNQVSTALNPGDVNLDPAAMPLGAGWILPPANVQVDTTSGVVTVDKLLANPKLRYDPSNPAIVLEADFVWYTHYLYQPTGSDAACVRTSWDFRFPDAPDAARWDFYTVMLHSLGHLLGVGHQAPDDMGTNVMQTALAKGLRRVIGPKELMCLCERYGPGQPACSNATATRHSTWGRLKATYR